jgi:hypothetical protein
MFWIAMAIVFYGVISNFKDLYRLWFCHRLKNIVEQGWFYCGEGRYKVTKV